MDRLLRRMILTGRISPMLPVPDVMTIDEAAEFLRLPLAKVRRLVRKHLIPHANVDGTVVFLREELLTWLRGKCVSTKDKESVPQESEQSLSEQESG